MCEILFTTVDKTIPEDEIRDSKMYKAGMVIAVQPNDWQWGSAEVGALAHQEWRMLRLPNVTIAQAASFLAPEIETDPQNPSPMRRIRGFAIDYALIVADGFNWPTNAEGRWLPLTLNITAEQITRYRKTFAPLANPLRL